MSEKPCKILLCLGANRTENEIISKLVEEKQLSERHQDMLIEVSDKISAMQKEAIFILGDLEPK